MTTKADKPMANPHNVQVGQTWADHDPRFEYQRILTIVKVHEDDGSALVRSSEGRLSRIKLSSFKPTATGYRLVPKLEPT